MLPCELIISACVSTSERRALAPRQRARATVSVRPGCRLLHGCARSAERLLRASLIRIRSARGRWIISNELTGSLPSELGALAALTELYGARLRVLTAAPPLLCCPSFRLLASGL